MGVKHSLIVLDKSNQCKPRYIIEFLIFTLVLCRFRGVLGRDLVRLMLMKGANAPAVDTLRRFDWSGFSLKDAPDVICVSRTD